MNQKEQSKRISKILLLGSGALKIGEAGEFDYSGTQAIKALKEEGVEVILLNPNVATIQTSKGLADQIYFLPVTGEFAAKVIRKEHPDGILLSFGGQTALNCGIKLHQDGILSKFGVRILGTPIQTVIDTEDRLLFSQRLDNIGLKTAKGLNVSSVKAGMSFAKKLGYPVMVRTGFALGGTGSGVARNSNDLLKLLTNALAISKTAVVEEDLTGWKEIEYEVVRDSRDNCITVCNMENFDPVGIHTGESIVVAPSQTLSDQEYYGLRQISIAAIRELKIVGECNIQFAINPKKFEYRIIEVNARLSRSSALASKATGYPLAYVAAKLALGKTLPELRNQVTGKTSAFFEPSLDYIVVKMPRWDLDKFTHVHDQIGTEMKSVGEVMSIGRSFPEAIQKAARMLNDGYDGVIDTLYETKTKKELIKLLKKTTPLRLFTICSALNAGITVKTIIQNTQIDPWFIAGLSQIITTYQNISQKRLTKSILQEAKQKGFSDLQIAKIKKVTERQIRNHRLKQGIIPFIKQVDTMAGEFPAHTNYLYLTYNGTSHDYFPVKEPKAAVIGSGPYSIGTSVEFDWCCVSTVKRLRNKGLKTIMVNCNPETVSTDYDYSDYLYFEELTLERLMDIYDLEKAPYIVSVGGQIANNVSTKLAAMNVPILGTNPEDISRAEDRNTFGLILDTLGIAQPAWQKVKKSSDLRKVLKSLGYPALIRPSFVLSGKAMIIVRDDFELDQYLDFLPPEMNKSPMTVSRYLEDSLECDYDGVAQKGKVLVSALSEHVESGGVHSGDSTLLFPSVHISKDLVNKITYTSAKIIKTLNITGPFNLQFLVKDQTPYVIECNARASRSFPFVSKALDFNFINLATDVILGLNPKPPHLRLPNFQAVKAPQFSFHKLRGSDPVLKVEMNSTGEVAGFSADLNEAYLTAVLSTGISFPVKKAVFISLGGAKAKIRFIQSAKLLIRHSYTLYATGGTAMFLKEQSLPVTPVGKVYEGIHPNSVDLLQDKWIDFAIVTPESAREVGRVRVKKALTDGYLMRRMAVDMGIPIFSVIETAQFFIQSVCSKNSKDIGIKSWNELINMNHQPI